jgi:two-component system, NtrC family, response regulator PilR
VKLLRVLQERLIRPVGAQKEVEVDVRVVAATNRDLEAEVEAGRFRQDLFYRLNVIRIHLPPLRERPEDIPTLAEHFLQRHTTLSQKTLSIAPEAMRWIASQRYPGNVRELENVIERAVTLSLGPQITLDDLPDTGAKGAGGGLTASPDISPGFSIDDWLGELEKATLVRALQVSGGNQKATAKALGTTFHSLRYRLRKYGLVEPDGDESNEAG